MFKRRKPDEGTLRDPAASASFAPSPFAPQPFSPEAPGTEPFAAGPGMIDGLSEALLEGGGAASFPPDTGLGVPPFRPAPPKEASMARPSLPTPNAPAMSQQPGGSGHQGIPQSVMAGGSQGYGTPPAAQGRPAPTRPQPQGQPHGPERRTLVVGRGISVQGTVQDAERLVVEGTVEASLIKATELSIALGGLFKGEVEVTDAEVAGTIDGTLTASGNLIVRSTGKVLGVARCRRLQVEDGGSITGRIEMLTDGARTDAPRMEMAAEPAA